MSSSFNILRILLPALSRGNWGIFPNRCMRSSALLFFPCGSCMSLPYRPCRCIPDSVRFRGMRSRFHSLFGWTRILVRSNTCCPSLSMACIPSCRKTPSFRKERPLHSTNGIWHVFSFLALRFPRFRVQARSFQWLRFGHAGRLTGRGKTRIRLCGCMRNGFFMSKFFYGF